MERSGRKLYRGEAWITVVYAAGRSSRRGGWYARIAKTKEGVRMISAWWLIAAFFGGIVTGVFLISLVSGNRSDDE